MAGFRRIGILIILCFALILLNGCDAYHAISRDQSFAANSFTIECVENALRYSKLISGIRGPIKDKNSYTYHFTIAALPDRPGEASIHVERPKGLGKEKLAYKMNLVFSKEEEMNSARYLVEPAFEEADLSIQRVCNFKAAPEEPIKEETDPIL